MALIRSETLSTDEETKVNVIQNLGYDGVNLQRVRADALAKKITISGDTTYIAYAAPGTLQSEALWQVQRIVTTAVEVTVTWADGNPSFDNVATDLTALSYS
jgi:hypothetical protein